MDSQVMLADIGGLLLLPIGLLGVAFWVWMIVDCARYETGSTMVAWLLAILFAGVIAAPLYFFLCRLVRQRSTRSDIASPSTSRGRKTVELNEVTCKSLVRLTSVDREPSVRARSIKLD